MPANGLQKSSDKNDVLLDRQGNVYKPGQTGEWQQLAGEKRTPASNTEIMDLDRQMQSRERSMNRNTSFNGTKQTPKRMNTTNMR
jgi:hypothetical protein